jgi:hypothetical protein
MRKTKTILLLFLMIALQGNGCVHRSVPQVAPSDIPRNQYVRIEFQRFDEQRGIVWLRLSNWTAWAIRIPVEMARPSENVSLEIVKSARNHKDGAEAPVRYYLQEDDPGPWMQMTTASGQKLPPDEPEHPPVPKVHRYDFLTEWWVPVKQTVTFQVPKEHLARNVALYVDMRYEWESLGVETLDGPVHRVFYRGIDLPKDIQAKIK